MEKGQIIYFMDTYDNFQSGTIIEENGDLYSIKLDIGGTMNVLKPNCYKTKQECLDAYRQKQINRKNEIKNSLKTKDDIIRFALDNCIDGGEEYLDYTAREAVIEKTIELGIKLN